LPRCFRCARATRSPISRRFRGLRRSRCVRIASSGLRWPVAGVEAMRILTRSSRSHFEKAHPHPPRPESSSARVKQEGKLGGRGLHFDFRSARNGYSCNA
jgi:hypothetical protein